MISLHRPGDGDADSAAIEFLVCEPPQVSGSALEDAESVDRFERSLRTWITPATRVMLAYACGIGSLPEAAEDYLVHLEKLAVKQLESISGHRF
jgi:hypothetical protein